ncbi:hypothetical protein F0160_22565 [Paraburkholderia sp. JPY303]|uniref:hypothetical protein n=1 Tax=Paraburkholderia atlantica TaxID=2654982 RepID=UPI0015906C6A|nr:hypothetical protein [Paraburkholderia atlantica]NUY33271.1 hypothetical protein [Paraburkholderia atlantica]
MTGANNKQYTIEVSEGEAEQIEQRAKIQGVTAPDFIVSCIRAACFGFFNMVDRLADAGQSGTSDEQ